jgi:hypothetical protein
MEFDRLGLTRLPWLFRMFAAAAAAGISSVIMWDLMHFISNEVSRIMSLLVELCSPLQQEALRADTDDFVSIEAAREHFLRFIARKFHLACVHNEGSKGSRGYIFTTLSQVEGLKSHGKKMLLDHLPFILLQSGLLQIDDHQEHFLIFRHVCLLRKVCHGLESDFQRHEDLLDLDMTIACLLDSYNYYGDHRLNTHFILHAVFYGLVFGPPSTHWTFAHEEEHRDLKFKMT